MATRKRSMTAAERFFWTNAGTSYNPTTETRAEGRRRGAIALAAAEAFAAEAEWTFEWEPDDDGHYGLDCQAEEHLCCILYDRRGAVLGSLGAVCGADQHGYARVVQAELADEAMFEIRRALMEAI